MSLLGGLTDKVKMPKIAWIILSVCVGFVAVCIGIKVLQAQDVLIKVSDKYEMAVQRYQQAQGQLEAIVELRSDMDRHFAQLYNHLENMKRSAPTPEARDKIHVAQMALRDEFNRRPSFKLPREFRGPRPGRDGVHAATPD